MVILGCGVRMVVSVGRSRVQTVWFNRCWGSWRRRRCSLLWWWKLDWETTLASCEHLVCHCVHMAEKQRHQQASCSPLTMLETWVQMALMLLWLGMTSLLRGFSLISGCGRDTSSMMCEPPSFVNHQCSAANARLKWMKVARFLDFHSAKNLLLSLQFYFSVSFHNRVFSFPPS